MKFLHLGDLHLGKTLGDFDLIDDQKYILDQIISIIDDEAADAASGFIFVEACFKEYKDIHDQRKS